MGGRSGVQPKAEECDVKRGRYALILSALLLLTAGLWGMASGQLGRSAAGTAWAQSENEELGVRVIATPLARRDIERYVTYYGVLRPVTTVQVAAEVPGRIKEIPVQVGDRVEVGDPLLLIDTAELEAQVRQAEAGLAMAKANLERLLSGASADELAQVRAAVAQAEVQLENAQVEFERIERLYQSGSVSRQAYDGAATQLQLARSQLDSARARLAQVQRGAAAEDIAAMEAQVRQAEAALDLARLRWEKATLRAPVAGVISRRAAEVGEIVGQGAPIFTIVDLSQLSITLRAPGQDVLRLVEGSPVLITIEDDASMQLTGRLHRIDPVADAQSNLFGVEVRVDNQEGRLRAGFNAAARVRVAHAPNALAVPERAIVRREGAEGLYVVRDGRAVFVPAQFGVGDGRQWREVLSADGLQEGDLVITVGKEYVSPGAPVRVEVEQ